MTKDEFLTRFLLSPLATNNSRYQHHQSVAQASVLVPLIEVNGELEIILTKRASHLRHHAGQISFPGGRQESHDNSIIDTALREAEEEIGLDRKVVNIVGQLTPLHTISGFYVNPIIGFVTETTLLTADTNEVAEIFNVPLSYLLSSPNHFKIPVYHKKQSYPVHFMPYQQYNIWGATASILSDLMSQIAAK